MKMPVKPWPCSNAPARAGDGETNSFTWVQRCAAVPADINNARTSTDSIPYSRLRAAAVIPSGPVGEGCRACVCHGEQHG